MFTFLSYTLYWMIVGTFTSFINRTLPEKYIVKYSNLIFKRQINMSFCEQKLKIKTWKDKMPEMSHFDKSVFDKSVLKSVDTNYLEKYQLEIDKGLFAHSFPILFLLPIAKGESDVILWLNALFLIIIHIPFLTILRYNKARLDKFIQLINKRNKRRNQKITQAI